MVDQNREKLIQKIHDLIGPEIEVDPPGPIAVSWQVGSTSLVEGSIKTYNWLRNTRFCSDARLLDVTGFAVTGEDGTVTFPLTEAACSRVAGNTSFDGYVSVVATPRGDRPRFVTTKHRLVALPEDPAPGFSHEIEITILAWDEDGDAAPRTSVHWRCVAAVTASDIT